MRNEEWGTRKRERSSRCLCRLRSLIFLLFLIPAFSVLAEAQNTASLEAEISRLENLVSGAAREEQYNALISLSRLYQLSGNRDAQLRSLERVLALIPGDGRALVEQGRLFISMGEYDRASEAAAALLSKEKEYLLMGRFLLAQIEAFRSGNIRLLAALTDDTDFSAYKSGIYYTLWTLSGDSVWRNRLSAEFPQSPEAQIAASLVSSSPTPLWLLFPGRDSIRLTEPQYAEQASTTLAAVTPVPQTPAHGSGLTQTAVLQTGLFGREENARALVDSLRRAGFASEISRRNVSGSVFWAVLVPGGSDMNVTMQRLRDSGFDSFPVRP